MNHFSIEVSKALREIGVEGETGWYWNDNTIPETLWSQEHADDNAIFMHEEKVFPAYNLADILRLLEPIAEKVHGYNKQGWADFWAVHLAKLFRDGDYPKAEAYLLSIITK